MAIRRNLSDERMVHIQARAYYRAIKKYSEESKAKEKQEEVIKRASYSFVENILFVLNVFCFPWKIQKKFNVNNRIYDSILVLFVTAILVISGTLIWGTGLFSIIYTLMQLIKHAIDLKIFIISLAVGMLMMEFGSIFIIAGNEFSKVQDSNKIYAYSASILSLVSCIVAVISLMLVKH